MDEDEEDEEEEKKASEKGEESRAKSEIWELENIYLRRNQIMMTTTIY